MFRIFLPLAFFAIFMIAGCNGSSDSAVLETRPAAELLETRPAAEFDPSTAPNIGLAYASLAQGQPNWSDEGSEAIETTQKPKGVAFAKFQSETTATEDLDDDGNADVEATLIQEEDLNENGTAGTGHAALTITMLQDYTHPDQESIIWTIAKESGLTLDMQADVTRDSAVSSWSINYQSLSASFVDGEKSGTITYGDSEAVVKTTFGESKEEVIAGDFDLHLNIDGRQEHYRITAEIVHRSPPASEGDAWTSSSGFTIEGVEFDYGPYGPSELISEEFYIVNGSVRYGPFTEDGILAMVEYPFGNG